MSQGPARRSASEASKPRSNAPPTSVDDSVEHLARLHEEHERATTPNQRFADRVTNALGRPAALAIIVLAIIGWMCGNYVARRFDVTAREEFPFPDLAFVATIAALVIALLILATQRHKNQLAERRAQLTLQIAILSEKKVAKIIALLEEQRQENPLLSSRVEEEAKAMAQPVDPAASLESLKRAICYRHGRRLRSQLCRCMEREHRPRDPVKLLAGSAVTRH